MARLVPARQFTPLLSKSLLPGLSKIMMEFYFGFLCLDSPVTGTFRQLLPNSSSACPGNVKAQ